MTLMSIDCRLILRLPLLLAVALWLSLAVSSIHAKSAAAAPVIVIVGDSLSAEYGLARGAGWVAMLQTRLADNKFPHTLVNASISGETTSGGRTRLPDLLRRHKPALVIIELGANDALRGFDLATTATNLRAMIDASRATGARVLLVGMRIPPNYGPAYSESFFAMFGKLAADTRTPLVPFLLEGVAERRELFQADAIHPTAAAQARMLDNVWPTLRPLLGKPAR